jgi:hypothetical protein
VFVLIGLFAWFAWRRGWKTLAAFLGIWAAISIAMALSMWRDRARD